MRIQMHSMLLNVDSVHESRLRVTYMRPLTPLGLSHFDRAQCESWIAAGYSIHIVNCTFLSYVEFTKNYLLGRCCTACRHRTKKFLILKNCYEIT